MSNTTTDSRVAVLVFRGSRPESRPVQIVPRRPAAGRALPWMSAGLKVTTVRIYSMF